MKELIALKTASDLMITAMEAMITAQKINELLHKLKSEGRDMTDDDWAKVKVDSDDANAKLTEARKAAGFV